MASTDLLFERVPASHPAQLVFDESGDEAAGDITLSAQFPLSLAVSLAPAALVTISASFGLHLVASATYDINVDRPLVSQTTEPFQAAAVRVVGPQMSMGKRAPVERWALPPWQSTLSRRTSVAASHKDTLPRPSATASSQRQALSLAETIVRSGFDSMFRDRRLSTQSAQQSALPRRNYSDSDWKDRFRDRRPQRSGQWDRGVGRRQSVHEAVQRGVGTANPYSSRFQPGMVPPPGQRPVTPVVPPTDPCYLPSWQLVFGDSPTTTANLIFWCERHDTTYPVDTVIIPVRSAYVIINNVYIKRVSDNVQLPCVSLSLSVDADSWTWSFSAALSMDYLDSLMPTSEGPVELEVGINGSHYRFLAENVNTSRSFGASSLSIRGRGKGAFLASPYSPVLTFSNSTTRTAQQLMADVLTFNGVSIGWGIDWRIDDWLVPAGVMTMQGSYIDGLSAIAGAAGAYLQSHPTDKTMIVLPRYAALPRDWNPATADYELPSAATLQEGIEYVEMPAYNRVFVRGESQGIIAQVTLAGTAGDSVAPMVVDRLVTQAAAGRQRAMSVLGNTGRQALVSLRTPVFSETGVIAPGKSVRYVDGSTTRFGIVRSTKVDVQLPDVWQSLNVETHL